MNTVAIILKQNFDLLQQIAVDLFQDMNFMNNFIEKSNFNLI
jgi:hypothetical protein